MLTQNTPEINAPKMSPDEAMASLAFATRLQEQLLKAQNPRAQEEQDLPDDDSSLENESAKEPEAEDDIVIGAEGGGGIEEIKNEIKNTIASEMGEMKKMLEEALKK